MKNPGIERVLDKKSLTTAILLMIGIISVIHGLMGVFSNTNFNIKGIQGTTTTQPVDPRFLSESPFNMIRDLSEFSLDPTDKALLWHVPRGGDFSVSVISQECELPRLVDMSSLEDIERVNSLNLAQNDGDINLIISPFFTEASKFMMNNNQKGRAFTFMKNPIERELDHYTALSQNNQIVMTIEEYVDSEYSGNNWMLRHLIGKEEGALSLNDYEKAKLILQEKCIVLFEDNIEESLERWFRLYSGPQHNIEKWGCVGNMIKREFTTENKLRFSNYSPEYKALKRANSFDIKLYSFAKYLFLQQGKWFSET